MLTAIVLLWMAIKLQAPTWIYVLIVLYMALLVINTILDMVNKIQKRKLEKLQNELADKMRTLGINEDAIDRTVYRKGDE